LISEVFSTTRSQQRPFYVLLHLGLDMQLRQPPAFDGLDGTFMALGQLLGRENQIAKVGLSEDRRVAHQA
jgi:hypothetical protein